MRGVAGLGGAQQLRSERRDGPVRRGADRRDARDRVAAQRPACAVVGELDEHRVRSREQRGCHAELGGEIDGTLMEVVAPIEQRDQVARVHEDAALHRSSARTSAAR